MIYIQLLPTIEEINRFKSKFTSLFDFPSHLYRNKLEGAFI